MFVPVQLSSTIPKSLLEFIVTFLTVFTVLMQTVRTAICLKALNHAHRGCREFLKRNTDKCHFAIE